MRCSLLYSTTDDNASVARMAAATGVQKALEAFVADAGAADGEGLSSPRLVRLTAGLARCVDEELQETAAICQVRNIPKSPISAVIFFRLDVRPPVQLEAPSSTCKESGGRKARRYTTAAQKR